MSASVHRAAAKTGRASRRRLIVAGVLLVAAAILVPPSISLRRFQPEIAGALSTSVARPVSIGEVHMRLLPAPALVLSRVVVNDDRAFSQEPILRSDRVTAWLRLTSLWRGRLEIARLAFDSPSFNLVRRPDGHWNLESLLERARETPVAPTAKRTPGPRSRFPYIEFDSARVNLKLGVVKTVFALADADFALWLEREDEWHLRLSAQPIRTDANLGDTGTIKLSGTIRRASSLTDTPLDLHFVLDHGQLGQLSTLVDGRDRGWRGTASVSAELKGTPSALALRSSASVEDFNRYDIPDTGSVNLRTSCTAEFHSVAQQLDDVRCTSPVGGGTIEMRGSLTGMLPVKSYGVSAVARNVPAAAIALLVRHMKKDLPEDVSATGSMTWQVGIQRTGDAAPDITGSGVISRLSLASGRIDGKLSLGDVRFDIAPQAAPPATSKQGIAVPPNPTLVAVRPFAVDLDGDTPVRVQADFSRTGYRIGIKGDAGLKRLLQLSEALGVATPRFSADGAVTVDFSLSGEWAGFAQPLVLGSAKVKATAPVNGIGTPVQVSTATVNFVPDGINVDHLVFGWPKSEVQLSGSMQLPRRCTTIETCPVTFRLHADALSVESLNTLLNPAAQKRPWYAFIESSAAKNPVLARVSASGSINVDHFHAGGVMFNHVTGEAVLARGLLAIKNATAEAWDGKLGGSLRADFSAVPAQFNASGRLDGAAIAVMSGKTHPSWGTGKLNTSFVLNATGLSAASLTQSANGKINFDWRNGTVDLSLDGGNGPLRIREFRGSAMLRDGKLEFGDGKMMTPGGIYEVSGTAALDRQLSLILSRGEAHVYEITGTLEKPKVAPAAPAQARLNP